MSVAAWLGPIPLRSTLPGGFSRGASEWSLGPREDSPALRVDHTGRRAGLATVLDALAALGLGLGRLGQGADVGGALGAALGAYGSPTKT